MNKKSIRCHLIYIIIILFSAVFFYSLLININTKNEIIKIFSGFIRSDFLVLSLFIVIVLFVSSLVKGMVGKLIRLFLIVAFFGFLLQGLWAKVDTENNVIAGLLPRSDSNSYFLDSMRISLGIKASGFSSRANFPAFISLLMFITKQNMQYTLAVNVFLAALASYLSFEIISERFGTLPGILFFILTFFFYRPFSGKFLTENIAYSLGLIGFCLMYIGFVRKDNKYFFIGLICITFALYIRPGPIFIIPALIITFIKNKECSRNEGIILFVHSCIIIIVCFFIEYLYSRLFMVKGIIPFSNYSYTLYGLSKGGTGWGSIRLDYPNFFNPEKISVEELSQPNTVKWIYSLAFQNIRNNPTNLIKGILKQYPLIFNISYKLGFFSFIFDKNKTLYYLSQYLLYLFSFFSIFYLLKRKDYIVNILLFSFVIGMLLSIPLIPFSDQSQMRAYAGVIGFIALVPIPGFSFLLEKINLSKENKNTYFTNQSYDVLIFSILLILLICILPLSLVIIKPMDENIKTECKNGEDKALVKINKGSLIYVFSENEDYIEGLPNIRHKHFISSIHLFPYDNFVKLLEKLEPPYTITNTIDLIKNRGMTLIIKGNVTNLEEGLYTVCGKWQNEDINYMYSKFFFY